MPAAATPDAVRQRAYELWEQAGRPDGRDLEYWYQAESEFGISPSDLDRNPGIGTTPGTWDETDADPIAGDNTSEGDVMNDVEQDGSVSPQRRGRTNS